MKKLLIILLVCGVCYAIIDKANDPKLPYWEDYIADPNKSGEYFYELVDELQTVLNDIVDAVNNLISISQPEVRYFVSPDIHDEFENNTWRIIWVSADDFEIQKLIDGTWTKVVSFSYDDGVTLSDGSNVVTSGYSPTSYAGGESITFPNGFIIKHGADISTIDGSEDFTFGTAFPNSCISVTISRVVANTALPLSPQTISTTKFTINRDDAIDGNEDFLWQAMGY